jgi:hypothetical protein
MVIDMTSLLQPWWALRRVILGEWHGFSRSIQVGLFAQGLKNTHDHIRAFYAEYAIALTIATAATVQEHDDLWFELIARQLKVSEYSNLHWIIRPSPKPHSCGNFKNSRIALQI